MNPQTQKPESAKAVANEFLRLADKTSDPVTTLKLMKLAYFAHGWYLALRGLPLFSEAVQACKYGPVIEPLYHLLKQHGKEPISEPVTERRDGSWVIPYIEDPFKKALIAKVWEVYGQLSANELVNMTHVPGGPWATTWDGTTDKVIDNECIREYFSKKKH